ncbi:DUF2255 family protein [Mycetocola miduiensis]|nr:DUF2255 family protein [Mycetocola miduiensis]
MMIPTTTWTSDELSLVGAAEELQIASTRKDGTLRPPVTIWVVRVGNDIYVRSAYGPGNPWFVRAKASGTGRIRAGGVEKDVVFTDADASVFGDIDAAYHVKYDQFGAGIVGTVVGPRAAETTIKLQPRAAG